MADLTRRAAAPFAVSEAPVPDEWLSLLERLSAADAPVPELRGRLDDAASLQD